MRGDRSLSLPHVINYAPNIVGWAVKNPKKLTGERSLPVKTISRAALSSMPVLEMAGFRQMIVLANVKT